MSIVRLVLGIILISAIPTHWFLAGLTLGIPGFLLWAGLGIAGIYLIVTSFTSDAS